jgi:hypothetical protein
MTEIPEQRADQSPSDFTLSDSGLPADNTPIARQSSNWATATAIWLEERVVGAFKRAPNTFLAWLRLNISGPLDDSLEARIATEVSEGEMPPELAEEMRAIKDMPFPVDLIAQIGMNVSLLFARFRVYLSGISALAARPVSAALRPSLLSHTEIMRYIYLNPDQGPALKPLLDQLGIDDSQQEIAFDAMQAIPQFQQILTLRNRDLLTDQEAWTLLEQNGLSPDNARLVLELRWYYYTPSDIVTLTGREAFEPESIKRFGLDQEFDRIPEEIYLQAGLKKEQAEAFWVAHWQNPGIQQVFRMLHRLRPEKDGPTFTEADMDIYFNIADVTPGMRDNLKAISYLPLTRVDTRRMYEVGVLDYDGVKSSYQDQGYDENNATLLADFTVKLADFADRDLTRVQIEKLYTLGELDRDEFSDALQGIGYDEAEADLLVTLKIAAIESDRIESIIERSEWEYKRNLIDEADVNSRLGPEGIRAGRIASYVEQWDNENVTGQTLPTKTDIRDWFIGGLIKRAAAVVLLRKRHYSEETIDLYIESWGSDIQPPIPVIDLDDELADGSTTDPFGRNF